jgi:glyceraldehyde 3-phosphate dehydrogenase
MKVAINGFGRIGRSVFRILDARPDVEVVAINDIFDPAALVYLLRYDTIMGGFQGPLSLEGGELVTARGRTRILAEKNPTALPWQTMGVDVVIEATGKFKSREQAGQHLAAGAGRVILTVPAKDEIDYTVVLGVNDEGLKPGHRIISNASCTTNCLAPVAKVLHQQFGIVEGLMNTVHAYTNDQRLADVPHTDWRRSRAAAENIIPTTTGAARAVGKVLPELKGRLDGIASRVPVPDGSVVDLFVELGRDTSAAEVNAAIRAAAEGPLRGILQYTEAPVVSTDVIGNPHSSVFDASFTAVRGGRFLKCLSWYDNEWGYSQRVCDLLERLRPWRNAPA